jgi:hypothetical protein
MKLYMRIKYFIINLLFLLLICLTPKSIVLLQSAVISILDSDIDDVLKNNTIISLNNFKSLQYWLSGAIILKLSLVFIGFPLYHLIGRPKMFKFIMILFLSAIPIVVYITIGPIILSMLYIIEEIIIKLNIEKYSTIIEYLKELLITFKILGGISILYFLMNIIQELQYIVYSV